MAPAPLACPGSCEGRLGYSQGVRGPRRLGRAGGEARVPTATLTHGRPLADSSRTTSLALPRAPLASGLGGTRRQPLPPRAKGSAAGRGGATAAATGGGLGERGPAAAPPPRWPPPRAGGLLGLAGRAEPPCSCPPHCQGPPRAEQGGLCGGAPAGSSAQTSVPRAANWGKPEPREAPRCPRGWRNKGGVSPSRAEGPQGPRGHCWPVQPPLPCAWCNVDVELRSPPGPGQSRVPLVRPAGVSGLGRGWGQLLRPEPCPPLAPGRPSASQGLFPHVRLRQAARAHLPLLGRPLLGEASGQWARGSGQPRRGQGPGEQEGWGPACGVGGLSTASSRQKTLSGARCPCSSVSSANCSASCHKPTCGLVGVGRVLLAPLRSESSLRGLPASRDGSRPRSCPSLVPTAMDAAEVGSFL